MGCSVRGRIAAGSKHPEVWLRHAGPLQYRGWSAEGACPLHVRVVLLARAGRKPGSVPALPPVVVIPLGRPLPDGSCDQLEIESTRATPAGCPAISDRSCSRWGLPCPPRHRGRGALLPHRFTLTGAYPPHAGGPARGPRVGAGGLFSVALSFESPRLAVSQHPALRSPDFPRRAPEGPAATTCPARARSARTIPRSAGQRAFSPPTGGATMRRLPCRPSSDPPSR